MVFLNNSYLSLLFVYLLLSVALANKIKGEATTTEATPIVAEKMLDFREGLSEAGRLLGLDAAQGVAQLVSNSFSQGNSSPSASARPTSLTGGIMSGFFRLLGLDSAKLSAVTLNTLVFLAQLISTSLIKNGEKSHNRTEKRDRDTDEEESDENQIPKGTPLDWIMALERKEVFRVVEDSALAERFVEEAESRTGWDTTSGIGDCAIALVCRVGPVVHGLQKAMVTALRGRQTPTDPVAIHWPRMSPLERMYAYLPTAEQLQNRAEECDERYPGCSARFQD